MLGFDPSRTTRPQPMTRHFELNWIDRAGLYLAAVVVLLFLILCLFLIIAAGSAPIGRLLPICLQWMLQTLERIVIPAWFITRLTQFVILHLSQVFPSPKVLPGSFVNQPAAI